MSDVEFFLRLNQLNQSVPVFICVFKRLLSI